MNRAFHILSLLKWHELTDLTDVLPFWVLGLLLLIVRIASVLVPVVRSRLGRTCTREQAWNTCLWGI